MKIVLTRLALAAWILNLLASTSALAAVSADGEEKGNGTLPTRMEGKIESLRTGEVAELTIHVHRMIENTPSVTFVSACSIRGGKSYATEGFVSIESCHPATFKIVEVCIDDERNRADIVIRGAGGKPQHLVGEITFELDEVDTFDGNLGNEWEFSVEATGHSSPISEK